MDGRPGRPGGRGAAGGRLRGRRGAFGKRFNHHHDHNLNEETSELLQHHAPSRLGRPGCLPCRGSPATWKYAAGDPDALQASQTTMMMPMQRLKVNDDTQEKVRQDLCTNVDLRRRRQGVRGLRPAH